MASKLPAPLFGKDTGKIEIPLRGSDEIIEIDVSNLPKSSDLVDVLKQENAKLITWFSVALAYYKQGRDAEFLQMLDLGKTFADQHYKGNEKHKMMVLDGWAAYFVKKANKEREKNKKKAYFAKATVLYATADKVIMYDLNHVIGRAFYCLLEGEKLPQAEAQFNFVLEQSPSCIPALLGKGCLAFNKKDYRAALTFYRKALRTNPQCPSDVRVGIGHCFMKLGNKEKAELAYGRALEINPNCIGALIGMAVIYLNVRTKENIKIGVHLLSRAYTLDPTNPMVLNHLADHFFFKRDFQKAANLAMHALNNTDNDSMRAESCYQLGRAFHIQGDYDQAFQYYNFSTRFATPKFVLPQFGLGQMYIHRGEMDNAAQCFEKVLKVEPENYESMKVLSSLYASTSCQVKRDTAKEYLRKVTAREPDDVEAWIELAQLLEHTDPQESLKCYDAALKLFREKVRVPVPPEICNNVGSLLYRLGNYKRALLCFEKAHSRALEEAEKRESQYYISLTVTTAYNSARVYEALSNYDTAEKMYKSILKEHPNYVDCYLRLGCISRDKGQIYDASDWFKEALQCNQDNPDTWTLLGNLHLSKQEWGPGQKKFERILNNPETENDPYSMIALGNIWLQALHTPTRDKEKEKKNQTRALSFYKAVLSADPKNIWAANGIGCVLAHMGCVNEARDIFAQVREATADFSDVWLNIAHIYVDQKQFASAIQMYEFCMKKFFTSYNLEILLYLARAYTKNGQLNEAKLSLLKARRIAPTDTLILYNLSGILLKQATQVFSDEKSTLGQVLGAAQDIGLALKYFEYLAENGDRQKFDLGQAASGAQQCRDILSQAQYHVARARRLDEDEKLARQKQEEEREAHRTRQLEEQKKVEEQRRLQLEEECRKREEFKEQRKSALVFVDSPPPEETKSSKRRKLKTDKDEIASDDESADNGCVIEKDGRLILRIKREKIDQGEGSGRRSRKRAGGKKKSKGKGKKKKLSSRAAKNRKKVVSKETVVSSGDSDSEEIQKRGKKRDSSSEEEEKGRSRSSRSRSSSGSSRSMSKAVLPSRSRSVSRSPSDHLPESLN